MAHTGKFATKAECDAKASELVDATGWTEANINAWCLQAESFINCATKYNWSDAYAGLNAAVKYILTEAASNLVAIYGISYNMAGYTSRVEAEDMINILMTRFNDCMGILMSDDFKNFIQGA